MDGRSEDVGKEDQVERKRILLSKAYLLPLVDDIVIVNDTIQLVTDVDDETNSYRFVPLTTTLDPSEWRKRSDFTIEDETVYRFNIEEEDDIEPFEQLIVVLPDLSRPIHYYEARRNDLDAFEQLIPSHRDYYEELTVNDWIDEIVRIEQTIIPTVQTLLERLGYRLNADSAYIVGKGAQGVVVSLDDRSFVAKIFVEQVPPGPHDIERYGREITNRALLVQEGFADDIVPVLASISEGTLGLIIMPRIFQTLQQWKSGKTRREISAIASDYKDLRQRLVDRGFYHPDLLSRNIAVDESGRLQLFDLSDLEFYPYSDDKRAIIRAEKQQYERTLIFLLGEDQ